MTGNKITFKSKVESDDGNWSIKPAEDSCEVCYISCRSFNFIIRVTIIAAIIIE